MTSGAVREIAETLLDQLFEGYQREGINMPYTMEDFRREYIEERFEELTPEVRQKLLGKLTLQELLEGRSPEEIENYLRHCEKEAASPKRKKKK